jgi:peptidoglycan-associated lipoprotein
MMRRSHASLLVGAMLVAAVLTPSCKKPPETVPEPPAPEAPAPPPAPEPPPQTQETFPTEPITKTPVEPSVDELNRQGVLKTVYFGYDSTDLTEEARQVLVGNANWLKSNPNRKIRIEGHCDERGTVEYNLSLGERRAAAVRDYLSSLGIDASRVRIVSYGKERPADPGHGEAAWSKNRRGDFFIES